MIDRLDIVIDLRDVDRDAVFVRPFFHNAGLCRIGPGHPSDIDRPGNIEFFLRRRESSLMRACGHRERGKQADQHARDEFHDTIPFVHPLSSGRGWASTIDANPGDRGLPGFCPSVHPTPWRRAAALGPAPRLRGTGTLAANSLTTEQAACQPEKVGIHHASERQRPKAWQAAPKTNAGGGAGHVALL